MPELVSEELIRKLEMAGAYTALVSLSNTIELIHNHSRHSFSFDENQIASLQEITCFFLQFIESYNYHGRSEEVRYLESQIALTALLAEHVLESMAVDQILAHGEISSSYSSDLEKILVDRMYFIKENVEKVIEENRVKDENPAAFMSVSSSSTPLVIEKTTMVGFNVYFIRLMDDLTGHQSSQKIISLVGMGSIGKTTLARHAFEDLHIQHHFDILAWAAVSENYDVKEILFELLSRKGEDTIDVLGERLHKKLWRRRYLIVLDDMWSSQVWYAIRGFFPDDGNGSRVLITTQMSKVAADLGSSALQLHLLDDEASWKLFCAKKDSQKMQRASTVNSGDSRAT